MTVGTARSQPPRRHRNASATASPVTEVFAVSSLPQRVLDDLHGDVHAEGLLVRKVAVGLASTAGPPG
jgi:hypothetical protein